MLDLAKLESGRAEWQVVAIDLRAVVQDSLDATGQLFRARNVGLETRLPDAPLVVSADRDRLVQVFINLLSNAAKFAPADVGRVVIAASAANGMLRLSIADNGPGIRSEDQRLIFEKFGQAGDVMTDRPQGTGLGLPISRQIIEHFGGRLWVESVAGAGATFIFELPVARSASAAYAARASPGHGA